MGIRRWMDVLTTAFSSVLFLGYFPVASGTLGSLPAIALAYWLGSSPSLLLLLSIILFLLGIGASGRAERKLGRPDPSEVTIDEFVGMMVAFLWLPVNWSSIVLVFILYRAFDIFKPFPANKCERLPAGLGIMADDLVAGIYANLIFRIIILIL